VDFAQQVHGLEIRAIGVRNPRHRDHGLQIRDIGEIYEQPELKNTKLLFDKINKDRIANNKNYSCGKVCP